MESFNEIVRITQEMVKDKRRMAEHRKKIASHKMLFLASVGYPTREQIFTQRFMMGTERMDPLLFKIITKGRKYHSMKNHIGVRVRLTQFGNSYYYVKDDGTLYSVSDRGSYVQSTEISHNVDEEVLSIKLRQKFAAKTIQRNVRKWLGRPTYSSGRKGFVFRKAESSWNEHVKSSAA